MRTRPTRPIHKKISKPHSDTLLFSLKTKICERELGIKCDVSYPFTKRDDKDQVLEILYEPPLYFIQFMYNKTRKGVPCFKIFAERINNLYE